MAKLKQVILDVVEAGMRYNPEGVDAEWITALTDSTQEDVETAADDLVRRRLLKKRFGVYLWTGKKYILR